MKSGMVEVQLNWIFVLIAGAIILAVFFTFAQKQKDAAQIEVANTIIQDVETMITSAGATKGAARKITIPDIPIDLTCSEECSCTFSVLSLSRNFQEKVIFGPPRIEGTELLMWALPWEAPFRVTNLIFLSSPRVPVYIVYDTDPISQQLMEAMKKEIPKSFETRFIKQQSVQGIRNQNYHHAIFVYLNIQPNFSLHESFSETTIQAVAIQEGNEQGSATFYTRGIGQKAFEKGKTIPYLGTAGRYAAIFAQSDTMFACQMQKVYKRYHYMTQMYQKRTQQLPSALCEKGYQGAENIFASLVPIIAQLQEEGSIADTYQYLAELQAYNEDLLIQACPLLY